jgi:hypothetical protein
VLQLLRPKPPWQCACFRMVNAEADPPDAFASFGECDDEENGW